MIPKWDSIGLFYIDMGCQVSVYWFIYMKFDFFLMGLNLLLIRAQLFYLSRKDGVLSVLFCMWQRFAVL